MLTMLYFMLLFQKVLAEPCHMHVAYINASYFSILSYLLQNGRPFYSSRIKIHRNSGFGFQRCWTVDQLMDSILQIHYVSWYSHMPPCNSLQLLIRVLLKSYVFPFDCVAVCNSGRPGFGRSSQFVHFRVRPFNCLQVRTPDFRTA